MTGFTLGGSNGATLGGANGGTLGDKPPEGPAQWRIRRNNDAIEDDLYDVQVTDTANPFGNYAIAYLDDSNGNKFGKYTRGTRVDFEYSTNGFFDVETRFSGHVVEAREQDQQGADSLEVECYSFDQFLRRDTVSNNQKGNTITEALEDIIKTDTPVSWNAANVEVVDDQELTRSYRGENVENVLKSLRSISGDETFGVNSDLEFFFEPTEAQAAPRNIDNSQWFNYDIPEEGKETLNQVTVYYASGEKSVTVSNGQDKQELQNSLGTPDPITIAKEVSRPDIDNIGDARDVGEQILSEREPTLTGTVTTYGLLDAEPGDVINIEIIPRGISGNFRIAELQYNWGKGTTTITVVEKKGDQDEVLVRLSDSVDRLETQDVNRDGVSNRITSTTMGILLGLSGDVNGTNYDTIAATNALRNLLRDGWGGDGTVNVSEIAVGNGTSVPSRTDTSLGNELERVSVTESLPTAQSVLYESSFTTTDIREIGLFDANGDLLVRGLIPDTTLSSPVAVDVQIDVQNDESYDSGVVTLTGQTAFRDLIADNAPNLPTDYAYGSDSTPATESDTSLGNQIIKTGLDEINVQYADTGAEFDEITPDFAADTPLVIDTLNGRLEQAKVTWFEEAENADNLAPIYTDADNLSGGEGRELDQAGAYVEILFTPTHDIPVGDLGGLAMMNYYSFDGSYTIYLDGSSIYSNTRNGSTDVHDIEGLTSSANATIITAGTEHTLRIEADTVTSGSAVVDMIYAFDSRYNINFNPTFDSTTETFNGPEIYPEIQQVQFNTENTRRLLDKATATQQWNDTSNNQYIELSNDNGSSWIRTTNSQTASATFSSQSRNITTRIGLSRWTDTNTTTPTVGDASQYVTLHIMDANVDAITAADIGLLDVRGIVRPDQVSGSTFREAGEFDINDNALTRCTFAEFVKQSGERVISSEQISIRNTD